MPRLVSGHRRQGNRHALERAAYNAVEPLEMRMLMSASLERGTLSIDGSNAADSIVVSYAPNTGQTVLQVAVNSTEIHTFTASKVKRINIEAGRGDDSVTILELGGAIAKPATVFAGRGNDSVTTGAGNDSLYGADGDDHLNGGDGNNALQGGAGNDVLNGVDESSAAAANTAQPMAANGGSAARATPMALPTFNYTVTDLGILPGGIGARGVNNITNITNSTVGFSIIEDSGDQRVPHAMYKTGGVGATTDLLTLGGNTPGSTSIAYDINIRDEIVGESRTVPGGSRHAFYWAAATPFMRDLGGLGGETIAYGLNDFPRATITGETGGLAAWRVAPFGVGANTSVRIPNINGGLTLPGRAREVNNYDRNIPPDGIGDIMVGQGNQRAFIYDEAVDITIDLGTIRGATTSEALDVNSAPSGIYTVIGVSGENSNVENAWYWRPDDGRMLPLFTPTGNETKAFGVNNPNPTDPAGLVNIVGRSRRRNNNQIIDHAVVWAETAPNTFQMIDLQSLTSGGTGRVLEEAHAINDANWIVAIGTVPGDLNRHAFLLRPGLSTGTGANSLEFEGGFIKVLQPFVPGTQGTFNGKVVFNYRGVGDFSVTKNSVNMQLLTIDLQRNQLPSEGVVDFIFPVGGFSRTTISTTKGTGEFNGRATAFATLADGTSGTFLVSFQGKTSRIKKKDVIEGTYIAISSRGKVIKSGKNAVLYGSFGPR